MTTKQVQIKIAEFVGARWFDVPPPILSGPFSDSSRPTRVLAFQKPEWDKTILPICTPTDRDGLLGIPNYTDDLNAIHEVEIRLTFDQFEIYIHRLANVVSGFTFGTEATWHIVRQIRRATANQCAYALLLSME